MTSPTYIPPNANASPFEIADQEAAMFWAKKFSAAGCDPKAHIIPGNKKDNFWMMGETGPCGPCSELHVDLTPAGDTRGALVNKGSAKCIEIWNLVFIQFNANQDGTFAPLPAQHVDTGMGFERVTSIIQGTKNFTDFASARISNYETDIFRPIFDQIEKMSGKKYGSTLPPADLATINSQQSTDVAFRVIADHIRTLSFAIADGIQPGNTDRNYVLRRILRRAVRYGRTLGFHEPFFYKLVDVLAETMGDVFPEIRARKKQVQETIQREEEAFNKTLDTGIKLFENEVFADAVTLALQRDGMEMSGWGGKPYDSKKPPTELEVLNVALFHQGKEIVLTGDQLRKGEYKKFLKSPAQVTGEDAFKLYDTYGFPLDLTELMARERGLTVDKEGFEKLMEEQRARARAAQKKEVISLSQIETTTPTKFVGYENLAVQAKVLEVVSLKDKTAVILDASACYAEMGGQVGDTGELASNGQFWRVTNTQKSGNTFLHFIETESTEPATGDATSRGAHAPSRVPDRALAVGTDARQRASSGTTKPQYSRRNLPHFERPWAKYMVTFSTRERRQLTPPERDLVLKSVLYAHDHGQYQIYAACVMPDHVHLLFEPQIKEQDKEGRSVFWSLSDILQGIKSASAHNINKLSGQSGHVWEQESMDRMLRGQSDLEEKFHYICRNPWEAGIVDATESYQWLWTPGAEESRAMARVGAADEASAATREARVLPAQVIVLPAREIAFPVAGSMVKLTVDKSRRDAIQRHHTVTHLLHWALHEVASKEASQKGSFVGPDKLTFDFNSAPLTPAQLADIEKLVNERILENAGVTWSEVPYADVKSRKDVMQFFGDKYDDTVRVVQIGGGAGKLDGYSMELCGGTHTRATGEIGLFRIVGESAIAAGVRRIEAVAGLAAYEVMKLDRELIKTIAGKVNSPMHELEKKIESTLAHQKALEKEVQIALQRNASNAASELLGLAQNVNGIPVITHNLGDANGEFLQAIADSLKGRFKGVVVLGGGSESSVTLIATVSSDFTAKVQAGKIIQQIAPIVGGKGGGKPDNARGGGKDAGKLDEALAKAKSLLG
jgi:alanyl-tRNA synthetase/REP element-mobilizing transposase RayT